MQKPIANNKPKQNSDTAIRLSSAIHSIINTGSSPSNLHDLAWQQLQTLASHNATEQESGKKTQPTLLRRDCRDATEDRGTPSEKDWETHVDGTKWERELCAHFVLGVERAEKNTNSYQ
jgi:hypothetical protein